MPAKPQLSNRNKIPALNLEVNQEEDQNEEENYKQLSNRTPKLVDLNNQLSKQTNPSSQRSSKHKDDVVTLVTDDQTTDFQSLSMVTKEFESFSTTHTESTNNVDKKMMNTSRSHKNQLNQIINSYRKENGHIDECKSENNGSSAMMSERGRKKQQQEDDEEQSKSSRI